MRGMNLYISIAEKVIWNADIGWYDVSVPNEFVRLRDFGRISVYEFTSSACVNISEVVVYG